MFCKGTVCTSTSNQNLGMQALGQSCILLFPCFFEPFDLQMGKRKRQFQIEDIHYTNPKFSNKIVRQTILNRRYCLTTNGQAEKTISNRRYSLYQLQILKTRLHAKPFLNRRYCLTTKAQAEKTISNRGYSLYQPQIPKTRLYDKPFFNRRYCLTTNGVGRFSNFRLIVGQYLLLKNGLSYNLPTPNSQNKIVRQTIFK